MCMKIKFLLDILALNFRNDNYNYRTSNVVQTNLSYNILFKIWQNQWLKL